MSKQHRTGQEIAIIGMAGRFPGAGNIDEFWRNLRDGVESISFFSKEELEASGIDGAVIEDPRYVRANGILKDPDCFDAPFFGFSPREAEIMDPQHRVFLECAWECLENAGYDSERHDGRIGMFAGTSISSYLLSNLLSNRDLLKSAGGFQVLIGNDKDHLPTRVSYKLNLKGPSVLVQTACSTSLVAVHMACQSLLGGECDIALAGGVSIRFPQQTGYLYQVDGIASPDGHCRAFDARAEGTVSGSGVGIVALKRLADAIADRDSIQAIIIASAINNDGALKIGYTAPSIDGQCDVITEAIAMAEVFPETITYVEAHGTGTSLGDPIEVAALTQAFRAHTKKKGFCAIGSVKTNIGHLDAAAGVAGLIKTVLALKHRMIPPSLHFEEPNPKMDIGNTPFYVNAKLSEWKEQPFPRRAGLSSFGMGGTNAHVILEEAPVATKADESRDWQLLTVSAKTDRALEAATDSLADLLRKDSGEALADIAYTYSVGRRDFDHRRMLVCRDLDDARAALESPDGKRVHTATVQEMRDRPVVFMFAGQGSQYVNMALDLYRGEPTFHKHVSVCSKLLKADLGFDLMDVLYPTEAQFENATRQIDQTAVTQPALFVIEYALAGLWMEWGIQPEAMIGHSIGEYVAACLAGVFSLDDALALIAARGKLIQTLTPGAMLSVALSEKEARTLLGRHLSLAAINAPSLCVVSGPAESVDELEAMLIKREVACRRLQTSHAFHSQMLDPILDAFAARAREVGFKKPVIPFVSNLTGGWITARDATDPDYWVKHMRNTVRFAEGVTVLLKDEKRILLEIGPGRTLTTIAQRQAGSAIEPAMLSSLRHPLERRSDVECIIETLGKLWLAGAKIDWTGFYANQRRRRAPLPSYPFMGERYWVAARNTKDLGPGQSSLGARLDIADWFHVPSWKRSRLPAGTARSLRTRKKTWLMFCDQLGFGPKLAERLEQDGQDVVKVINGESFARLNQNLYVINPQEPRHYRALLADLVSSNNLPAEVVHLWNVSADESRSSVESWEDNKYRAFYSLVFLAQAIGDENVTNGIRISVVTSNVHEVVGDDLFSPINATSLGPCKVIPQEYPNIRCRNLDIAIADSGVLFSERDIDQIAAELASDSTDPIVAYRGKHRWTPTFDSIRLNQVTENGTRLRDSGVYLITGGMGGIGFALAQYLAQTVRARLVLTGRSYFPDKQAWPSWLGTHDADEISDKIRKIQRLEELGAEVLIVSADVSNIEQMRTLTRLIQDRFGKINGVIHAAGIPGGGLIQLRRQNEMEAVFAPKIRGALVLTEVLKDTNLDFFILCSSLSAILGGIGQVDYCAANAFLDAFAHHSESRGIHTASINWDMWQEVGMAVNEPALSEIKQPQAEAIKNAMLTVEGLDAFGRILSSELCQTVVSTGDLAQVIEHHKSLILPLVSDGSVPAGSPRSTHHRGASRRTYVAAANHLEETLVKIWEELLGIDQIGIHDSFFELGGHSLLGTMFVSRARESLKVNLSLRTIFEAPTIAELAVTIEEMFITDIERLTESEAFVANQGVAS